MVSTAFFVCTFVFVAFSSPTTAAPLAPLYATAQVTSLHAANPLVKALSAAWKVLGFSQAQLVNASTPNSVHHFSKRNKSVFPSLKKELYNVKGIHQTAALDLDTASERIPHCIEFRTPLAPHPHIFPADDVEDENLDFVAIAEAETYLDSADLSRFTSPEHMRLPSTVVENISTHERSHGQSTSTYPRQNEKQVHTYAYHQDSNDIFNGDQGFNAAAVSENVLLSPENDRSGTAGSFESITPGRTSGFADGPEATLAVQIDKVEPGNVHSEETQKDGEGTILRSAHVASTSFVKDPASDGLSDNSSESVHESPPEIPVHLTAFEYYHPTLGEAGQSFDETGADQEDSGENSFAGYHHDSLDPSVAEQTGALLDSQERPPGSTAEGDQRSATASRWDGTEEHRDWTTFITGADPKTRNETYELRSTARGYGVAESADVPEHTEGGEGAGDRSDAADDGQWSLHAQYLHPPYIPPRETPAALAGSPSQPTAGALPGLADRADSAASDGEEDPGLLSPAAEQKDARQITPERPESHVRLDSAGDMYSDSIFARDFHASDEL